MKTIKIHKRLGLKDLRSHINFKFGLADLPRTKQIPLDTIKEIAMSLCEAKLLSVREIGNSYQFRIEGQA